MTKEEILAMEPGKYLDRMVAQEVMDEKQPQSTPQNALDRMLVNNPIRSEKGNWVCLCDYEHGDIPEWHPLNFSTDISAAWQVVERMEELGFYFRLDSWEVEFYASGVDMSKNTVTFGALASRLVCEAICKAALLAKHSLENKK